MTRLVQITIATPTQTDTELNHIKIVTDSMKLLIQHTSNNTLSNLKLAKNTKTQAALIAYLISSQTGMTIKGKHNY